MRRAMLFNRCAVALSMLGMLTGQLAQAATPVSETTGARISDVGLQDGGTLRGVVVNSAGAAEASVSVVVKQKGEVLASTRTGPNGEFAFRDVSPGLVELETPAGRGIYRLWAPRTAPPSAESGILLVDGQHIQRGQGRSAWLQSLGGTLANPWVLALIVAGAIAIPLALDSDDAS